MSMLLNALLLVLREVLEAAVLLGLLWNYSKLADLPRRWVIPAGLVGGIVAMCYAAALEVVSDWWDGSGQERISAALHLAVYVPVVVLGWGLYRPLQSRIVLLAMGLVFVAASVREGSEILIYVGAFIHAPGVKSAVFSGALIGAGIGVSSGILVSAFLGTLAPRNARTWVGMCLILVASGMMLQAVALLDQAGLVAHSTKAFDAERWLPEQSVLGQLLYAVLGYDSQPSGLQLGVYLVSFSIAYGTVWLAKRSTTHD